ncbi:MAG: DUF485 domain-containing protein [Actinomycetales bacterium]|nr:DUF485 domain-containing protein [Actinomycetales bacterium]
MNFPPPEGSDVEPAVEPETSAPPGEPTPEQYVEVQQSEDFSLLRRSFRGFAIPMTIAFLVWYFAYVLLSTYAEGLMATPLLGNLNLGIVLGLSQFVMTFLITWLYIRHANKSLDPISARLRDQLEGDH